MNIKIIPLALIALSLQIGTGWAIIPVETPDDEESYEDEDMQCSVETTCYFEKVTLTLGENCATFEDVLIHRYCPNCAHGIVDEITHEYVHGPTNDCVSAKSCKTCPSGYTLVEKAGNFTSPLMCRTQLGTVNSPFTYKYKTCEKDSCTGKTCTNCNEGYSQWTVADINGLQTRTYTKCYCGNCLTANTGRRCAAGFYGTGFVNLETGADCTKCPTPGSSLAGSNKEITNCFQSDGSDTTGRYIFTPTACYYSL